MASAQHWRVRDVDKEGRGKAQTDVVCGSPVLSSTAVAEQATQEKQR